MASVKKFLDQQGTGYLWTKIVQQLETKAAQSALEALSARVDALNIPEEYDDTELRTLIGTKADSSTVDTLVGEDTDKSVRTIANEELAAQLIPQNAVEARDTLQEIAAWIQSHPNDASAMNQQITAINNILAGIGGANEPATVAAYVNAAIAALGIGNYALASDLTALATRTAALESVSHTHSNKDVLDDITATDITAWNSAAQNAMDYADSLASNYATAAQGALADTALQPDDIVGLTNAEIDEAIANVNSSTDESSSTNTNLLTDEQGNNITLESGEPLELE